jgi:hypothetical protein
MSELLNRIDELLNFGKPNKANLSFGPPVLKQTFEMVYVGYYVLNIDQIKVEPPITHFYTPSTEILSKMTAGDVLKINTPVGPTVGTYVLHTHEWRAFCKHGKGCHLYRTQNAVQQNTSKLPVGFKEKWEKFYERCYPNLRQL